jgi:ketosteroid isomerase-like protein
MLVDKATTKEKVMVMETITAIEEAQVRQVLDDFAKAMSAKDIERVMAHYHPDVVAFDIVPPLQYVGAEAYRKNWEEGFAMSQSIRVETRDLSITASGDAAFCHSLTRLSGTMTNGKEYDFWMRRTVCCRNFEGELKITHEHFSVPFEMESNRALFDLKP